MRIFYIILLFFCSYNLYGANFCDVPRASIGHLNPIDAIALLQKRANEVSDCIKKIETQKREARKNLLSFLQTKANLSHDSLNSVLSRKNLCLTNITKLNKEMFDLLKNNTQMVKLLIIDFNTKIRPNYQSNQSKLKKIITDNNHITPTRLDLYISINESTNLFKRALVELNDFLFKINSTSLKVKMFKKEYFEALAEIEYCKDMKLEKTAYDFKTLISILETAERTIESSKIDIKNLFENVKFQIEIGIKAINENEFNLATREIIEQSQFLISSNKFLSEMDAAIQSVISDRNSSLIPNIDLLTPIIFAVEKYKNIDEVCTKILNRPSFVNLGCERSERFRNIILQHNSDYFKKRIKRYTNYLVEIEKINENNKTNIISLLDGENVVEAAILLDSFLGRK